MSFKVVIKSIWNSDSVRRVLHTFWEVAGGALVAGLLTAKSTADVKLAVATAVTVGLAAVKNALVARG